MLYVALAVALAPIVLATVRAIHRGWLPVGDNGQMYVRTTDVFSRSPPLLGIWSFGSVTAKEIYSHPGPLLYDFFAIPTKLFGPVGMAVAVALLNGAALVGIAFVGRRLGGTLLAAVAVAGGATLCWTMGNELLIDPWTPNSLLVLFLLFLMLIWASSSGDLIAFPLAIGVGSFLLETNLSYGLLVLVLWVWAAAGLFLHLRRTRGAEAETWPALRLRAVRTGIVATVVFVVCWTQPIIEQFTSKGDGNLTRIVEGLPMIKHTLGLSDALRLVGGVAAVPPWWLRPSMVQLYQGLPSLPVALLCLAVPAALLAWYARNARRRGDRVVSAAVVTAAISLVLGIITTSRSPVYGTNLQAYQTRFLWPLAAFLAIVVVVGLIRRVVGVDSPRTLVGLFALATLLVTLLNLPFSSSDDKTHAAGWTMPIAADLGRQLKGLKGDAPLLVHWDRTEQYVYQFYVTGLLVELRRRNVPFVVDEGFLIRSLGDARRFTGHNAKEVVWVASGTRADTVPSGARRIAFHAGLDPQDQRELTQLEAEIRTFIRHGDLHLDARGTAYFKQLAALAGHTPPTHEHFDAGALLGPSRNLMNLVTQGFLVLDPRWTARFGRYQFLQSRSDQRTVAVYAAPLGGRGVKRFPASRRP